MEGRRLVAREPLRYPVTRWEHENGTLYTLEGEFDIFEYGFSREMLVNLLNDTLEWMWREFVGVDQSQVSPRACELGVALGRRFASGSSAIS